MLSGWYKHLKYANDVLVPVGYDVTNWELCLDFDRLASGNNQ